MSAPGSSRDRTGERRTAPLVGRAELQAAVKYGRKEPANPGWNGEERWKYTHRGVVYITDSSSRQEITSWPIDDCSHSPVVGDQQRARGVHAILIVDDSGSMRKDDVQGYSSRKEAVFDCLSRDFVESQLAAGARDVVVTLIEMRDEAKVVFHKMPLDAALSMSLKHRGRQRAMSHGNYLPALDRALEIMRADASHAGSFLLLFLSDGAPSDHFLKACTHGYQVWQPTPSGRVRSDGKKVLINCPYGSSSCRLNVMNVMRRECIQRVQSIGDMIGRERIIISTVGFGNASEDFVVLQEMSEALPRNSFTKLGVNPALLRTAISNLSSSLTTLTTEGRSSTLTLRSVNVRQDQERQDQGLEVKCSKGWWIYHGCEHVEKFRYELTSHKLVPVEFENGATGLAFFETAFAQGIERFVYRCTEISIPPEEVGDWYTKSGEKKARRTGYRLVAKEAKHLQNLGIKFQMCMARTQGEAAGLAVLFNRKADQPPKYQLNFLPLWLYRCRGPFSEAYPDGEAWEIVERELEGKFTKWNNNNGQVLNTLDVDTGVSAQRMQASLPRQCLEDLAIVEEDEDEWSDDDDNDAFSVRLDFGQKLRISCESDVQLNEVPQAFSHFTYHATDGKMLVCDLQGVWNSTDGFVLTDPAIHYAASNGKRHLNGLTDKGARGMLSFFETHTCGTLCRKLGLLKPSLQNLSKAADGEKARACVVCLDLPRSVLLKPCGHVCCCDSCAWKVKNSNHRCPLCRSTIMSIDDNIADHTATY